MQNLLTILATATLAMAAAVPAPADLETRQATLCPGLLGTPQCCGLSVLGVATLPCADPAGEPKDTAEFQATCAETGDSAQCCLLPLDGIGLVCQAPA